MQIYFNIPTYTNQMNIIKKQNKNQSESLNYFNCNSNVSGSATSDVFFGISKISLIATLNEKNTPKREIILQRSKFLDKLFPNEKLKDIDNEEVLIKKMNEKTASGESIVEILTNVLKNDLFNADEKQRQVIEQMFLKDHIDGNIDIMNALDVSYTHLNSLKQKVYLKIVRILKENQTNENFNNITKPVASRLIQLQYLFPNANLKGVKSFKELKQRMKDELITNSLNEILKKEDWNEDEKKVLEMWFGLGDEKPLSIKEIENRLGINKARRYIINTRKNGIKKLKSFLEKKD